MWTQIPFCYAIFHVNMMAIVADPAETILTVYFAKVFNYVNFYWPQGALNPIPAPSESFISSQYVDTDIISLCNFPC